MTENRNLPAASAPPGEVFYRCPEWCPPPRGVKLLLLTEGGTAVIGLYSPDGGFVGWSPLPKGPVQKGPPRLPQD